MFPSFLGCFCSVVFLLTRACVVFPRFFVESLVLYRCALLCNRVVALAGFLFPP